MMRDDILNEERDEAALATAHPQHEEPVDGCPLCVADSEHGWTYDPADPSVGIMSGVWWHESCTADDLTPGLTTDMTDAQGNIACGGCGAVLPAEIATNR